MAIVNLKNVECVGTFSKGFRVVEKSTSNGKEYTTRWTVWSDTLGVTTGDVVSLSGFLSAKVSEWTDKEQQVRHSVELSINSPRLSNDASSPAGPQDDDWSQPGPVVDSWNDDSNVPF